MAINFEVIKVRSLERIEEICERWLPGGKRVGREWQVGDRYGTPGQSLKVHLSGGKAGIWADFSTEDKGGDLISLVAYVESVPQGEAAKRLAVFLGIEHEQTAGSGPERKPGDGRGKAEAWLPIIPIPEDAPPRPEAHRKHGRPNVWHIYRDANERLLGYVARFEASPPRRPKKEFGWLVFAELNGKREWRWQGFAEPRPLFGLDRLAAEPERPVLIAEGEKACEASRMLFPGFVCLAWPGGGKAVGKADFSPLREREVVLFPDHDGPGQKAMVDAARLIAEAGAASLKTINTGLFAFLEPGKGEGGEPTIQEPEQSRELADGWDAADALAEGWTAAHIDLAYSRADFFLTEPTQAAKAANSRNSEAVGKDEGEGEETHDARFEVSNKGLYFIEQDKEGGQRRIRVSDPLRVPALARDLEGAGWAPVLEFQDMDGLKRQEIIPRRMFLGDGTDGPKQLADLGLFIEPGRQALDRLKTYIGGARPSKRARLVDSSGWHGNAYLLPAGAIGDAEETLIHRNAKRVLSMFASKGKLADWQNHIAQYAVGNPRLMFSISVALAGPLLKPCGGPSFAFHWVGDSSDGKSGSLFVAGSVWGNPAGMVHSWRHSDNALEYTAAQHNDGLLILDELKEVDPKQAGAIAYMLSNSKGKGRAHHSGGLREVTSWRVVMLSSGELGLADHMATAGQKSHAGQTVRFIEIPSNGGAGLGMWRELHGMPDGRAFTDTLRANAAKYHGTAGKAFVAALIDGLGEVPGLVKKLEEAFFVKFVPLEAASQVKRVAGCFALVAAAGELAAELKIVPWGPREAFEAAGSLFEDWTEGRPTVGNLEEAKILAHVRSVMEKGWQSRFVDWARVSEESSDLSRMAAIQEPLGFRKKDIPFNPEEPSFFFYVTRERFKEELARKAGFDYKRVAGLLRDRSILKCDADGTTLKEKLPNGDSRSYCIVGRKLWEAA